MFISRRQPPSVPERTDPEYFRAERTTRYTYTPLQRVRQRLAAFFVAVVALLGYDLSAWQLKASPEIAKNKGIMFAFLRALYGLTPDTKFPQHYPQHKGIIKRDAYLYYKDNLDPLQQAVKLYETCLANGGIGDLAPVLDVESINNPTLTASKIKACAEKLESLFGKKPIIYTGYYVWRDEVTGDKTWAAQYELWIAAYPFTDWKPEYLETVKNYPPLIPAPWTKWAVWQWSCYAPAQDYGVSGNFVDLNYCTEAFAVKYGIGATQPPPPVGEDEVKYITLKKYNIRAEPNNTALDCGDIPINTVITALDILFTPQGAFVEVASDTPGIDKISPTGKYYVAGFFQGQGQFLKRVY